MVDQWFTLTGRFQITSPVGRSDVTLDEHNNDKNTQQADKQ